MYYETVAVLNIYMDGTKGLKKAGLERKAEETGISPEAFSILYYEKALPPLSCGYNQLEYELGALCGSRYEETKEEFSRVLASVKRANSLVENLNSRDTGIHGFKAQGAGDLSTKNGLF